MAVTPGTPIRVFSLGGKYLDWYSGMPMDDSWIGPYVYHDWVMETWFDRATGERAVRAIRPWKGYHEEKPPRV